MGRNGSEINMGKRPRGFMRKRLRRLNSKHSHSEARRSGPAANLTAVQGAGGIFRDSTELASVNWTRLQPRLTGTGTPDTAENTKCHMRLLKAICAESVARNVDSVEPGGWDDVHHRAILEVWNEVLRLNRDSPRVFATFARILYRLKDFLAHDFQVVQTDEVARIRSETVNYHVLINSKRHRIEILYQNVQMRDVLRYTRGLETCSWVLLDLRSFRASKDQMLQVINIQNLVCLDCSYTAVDDSFLHSLASSICREGKLSKLTVLRLVGCENITPVGLNALMRMKDDFPSCSLCCIELDHNLASPGTSRVLESRNWFLPPDGSIMSSIPMALKLQYLFKNHLLYILQEVSSKDLTTNPLYLEWSKRFVVLDLSYVEVPLSSLQDSEAIVAGWTSRKNANCKTPTSYSYIVDNHKPNLVHNLPELRQKTTKRSRPGRIKSDVKQFFDL